MTRKVTVILTFVSFSALCLSTPIVTKKDTFEQPIEIPSDIELDICGLANGHEGRSKLLEDCDTLDLLNGAPPDYIISYRGASLVICCPLPVKPFTGIIFPGDLEKAQDFIHPDDEQAEPSFSEDISCNFVAHFDFLLICCSFQSGIGHSTIWQI